MRSNADGNPKKKNKRRRRRKEVLFTLPSRPGRFFSLYYLGIRKLAMPAHKV